MNVLKDSHKLSYAPRCPTPLLRQSRRCKKRKGIPIAQANPYRLNLFEHRSSALSIANLSQLDRVVRPVTLPKKSPEVLHIRQTKLSDIPALHAVVNYAYRSPSGWTNEFHLVTGERVSLGQLSKYVKEDIEPVLVAELSSAGEGGKVIGSVQVQLSPTPGEGRLGMLSVDPDYQCHGVGRALVTAGLNYLRDVRHCKRAALVVIQERTELVQWYKKLGFADTGVRETFPGHAGITLRDLTMMVLHKEL